MEDNISGRHRRLLPYISGAIILLLTAFTVSTVMKLPKTHSRILPETSTRWYFRPSDQESSVRYFKPRKQRLNNYNHIFIEPNTQVCNHDETPFLVIISLTTREDIKERMAIRETWGKVVRGGDWPGIVDSVITLPVIKHVFIYAKDVDDDSVAYDINKRDLRQEMDLYGDIVIVDMKDTYRNLTTKVILGLKWVQSYCPKTRFVLKVDQDAFVHIPNLVRFLHSVDVTDCADMYGTMFGIFGRPARSGKWRVSPELYPFDMWPPYTSGTAYVISGKILDALLAAAEVMPLVPVEDAFITGILRTVIGARLSHVKGFPALDFPSPATCAFHNTRHVIATNVDTPLKRAVWAELETPTRRDCYTPPVWRYNNVSFDDIEDKPYITCD